MIPSLLTQAQHRFERRIERWAVASQLGARRNAMIACTSLAQLRGEREDVERFFADRRTPGAVVRRA